MAEADALVYADVQFTKDKKNANGVSSPSDTTYSDVRFTKAKKNANGVSSPSDTTYSDVKFTKAKKNANETVSSPTEATYSEVRISKTHPSTELPETVSSLTEATYSEVRISKTHPSTELPGSQQQAASNGGSKVTLKRAVAVAVLGALLVATVIALGIICYKKSLTDENEARNNLTDKRYLKCDEGWERNRTQCYYFSTNKLTWSESRAECRQRGGDLVKIDSVEEQAFLQQKLKEKMSEAEDKHWIGLTDSKKEGTWLWTDGSPLNKSLTFWSGNEPDNWISKEDPDGEDCVRMGEKGGSDLETWFDRSCKEPHKSICEKSHNST